MVDSQLFGAKAGGHHATNLFLHALNAVLLFSVLRRMTGAFWRSAAVAAFFAWHPLQVESVAWISERKDVLSGLFCLLALWAYVRYAEISKSRGTNSGLFYALALAFFAVGLTAKPMLVTLPCVLLLIDWWPMGRLRTGASAGAIAEAPGSPPASVSSLLIEKAPFFLLSLVSCVITVIAERREEATSIVAHLPFKARFITAVISYFHYIEKIVWPSDLGATYPFIFHLPKWQLGGIGLVLLGLTIVAVKVRTTRPYWLVGWLWFVGMLVPTLGLVFAGIQPMADRYMYLPSIGLLILICWDAYDMAGQWPSGRLVLGGLCAVALAGCCIASSLQLQYWRNEGKLLSRIAEPESNFMGHANYASYLMRRSEMAEAQAECEKAISIIPSYAVLHAEMGNILLAEGKFDEAIEKFRLVQKLEPRMVDIHLPWGRALLGKKNVEGAMAEFKTVISADPKNFEAYNYLGQTFAGIGRTGPAVEEYQRSLSLQPNQPDVLNNLAWIFATDPRPEFRNGTNAVKLATRAFVLSHGTQPIFLGTLAAAYAETGHFDDAAKTAQGAHDLAAAAAAGAQKASQPAVSRNLQSLADRELKLMELYKSHKPFRDQPVQQGTQPAVK